jgi:hypothetical protein
VCGWTQAFDLDHDDAGGIRAEQQISNTFRQGMESNRMSLTDKLAIQEVIALYSYAYDAQDAEGFAALFTEDAVWELLAAGSTHPAIRWSHEQRFSPGQSNDCTSGVDTSSAVTTNLVHCLRR